MAEGDRAVVLADELRALWDQQKLAGFQASQMFLEECLPLQRFEMFGEVVGGDEAEHMNLETFDVFIVEGLTVASLTFGSFARLARWSRDDRGWSTGARCHARNKRDRIFVA